jgi:hypothetical protein
MMALVIMTVTDEIVKIRMRQSSAQAIVVHYPNAVVVQIELGKDPVKVNVGQLMRYLRHQPLIAVVIAPDNVHRPGKTLAQRFERKGRIEVTTEDHHIDADILHISEHVL